MYGSLLIERSLMITKSYLVSQR